MPDLLPMNASLDSEAQALDEAAWVHEAALRGLFTPADIVRWADAKIAAIEAPPYWLIELSALKSGSLHDYAKLIEPELRQRLSTRSKISLIVFAFVQDKIYLYQTLYLLFRIWCPAPPEEVPADEEFGPISDLLVEWDLQESPEIFSADFEGRCREVFTSHLKLHGNPPSSISHLPSTISSC